jgi:hypothetical protein
MTEQKEFMFAVKAYDLNERVYLTSVAAKSVIEEGARELIKNWLIENGYIDIDYIVTIGCSPV